MKKVSKGKLIALIVGLYVLSPLDFLPGKIDDLVVVVFTVIKYLEEHQNLKFLENE